MKTLNNLDTQFQWDNLQKSQFYKGLPHVLPRLPHRVSLHRVVPCLAKEFVNPHMVPFVLPSGLAVVTNCRFCWLFTIVFPQWGVIDLPSRQINNFYLIWPLKIWLCPPCMSVRHLSKTFYNCFRNACWLRSWISRQHFFWLADTAAHRLCKKNVIDNADIP